MSRSVEHQRDTRKGLIAIAGAYGLWGLFPLYFVLTQPASALEVVAWRIIFSLVFCALILTVAGSYRSLFALVRRGSMMVRMLIAGLLIGSNWLFYVIAVTSGNTLEASLGYFINPLVAVLLGVMVLGERLRPLQWIAVVVAAVAVTTMALLYGQVPWIALGLAFSFGLYGLVKSQLGHGVSAINSLTAETLVLSPLALTVLGFIGVQSSLSFTSNGTTHAFILALSGIVTAIPLLCFAVAAANLPLSLIGIIQYATPTIQFFIALFIFGEEMSPARWIGFSLVWVAVALFLADAVMRTRVRSGNIKRAS
ncbi:EamA family transporter RarD [Rothia sp. ZJ1223]|uniref:EamA family transporter RarD n=1 Tax=Rothia sp. ZJ1223 TaxID=2811098 RepID=UPI00195EC051|nr:EamA family transporter RarD [Rothia sp. ZJ1223]MBM7051910.1 EamA family transporter RarD [Rothia sp. ZJ1223]